MSFNPNAAALSGSGIFGLPYTEAESELVLLPVPWEATTSYGGGTAEGPKAIFAASRQVDLYDLDIHRPYEPGICMLGERVTVCRWNEEARTEASKVIKAAGIVAGNAELEQALARVNALSEYLNSFIRDESQRILSDGKILGVVGGDHSVPLGAIQAIAEKYPSFGILHFDAHSDTRDAYEGFRYSHASIMRNVLDEVLQVRKIVQVGIRDVCEEEVEYCRSQENRVAVFYDAYIQSMEFGGETFHDISHEIIAALPQEVWISFDIDGLDPRFCPHTGTPVPGGLDFNEAVYIIAELVRSKRTIIGFDLNEVAPDPEGKSEWDANVGARLLYKLCAWTLASQGKCKLK